MSSSAVDLRQAADSLSVDPPFALLGHHRCDEESWLTAGA